MKFDHNSLQYTRRFHYYYRFYQIKKADAFYEFDSSTWLKSALLICAVIVEDTRKLYKSMENNILLVTAIMEFDEMRGSDEIAKL